MGERQTVSATEFKAKCLELFDRLSDRQVDQIEVTKRGRVVAIVRAPEPPAEAIERLHGFQKGLVSTPTSFDWTAPVLDEAWIDGEAKPRD